MDTQPGEEYIFPYIGDIRKLSGSLPNAGK